MIFAANKCILISITLKNSVMGKINNGITGAFSGKVGPVIGGSWKGISYMRSKPVRSKRPFTPKQLSQQARFATMVNFLQPLNGMLMQTFRNHAIRMSEFNNAISFNLKNAIAGAYPDFKIDPGLVLLSRGDLPNAPLATATCTVAGELQFNWKDNSGTGKADSNDSSILIAYSPDKQRAIHTMEGAARSTETAVLSVEDFRGLKVNTYLAFIAADGTLANSVYTGQVEIL
jgi:hypothetical protein